MAAPDPDGVLGTVYLLHFNQLYVPYPGAPAICCAGHYTGFAPGGPRGLKRRLAKHGTAEGARLMLVITRAGIGWQVARIWWPGNRTLERRLKVQGGASRRCPLCGVVPRPGPLPRTIDGRVSRILTTDLQKDAAGLMTAEQLAKHSGLRYGAVTGKLARPLDRGPFPASADPWALPLPALAGGERA